MTGSTTGSLAAWSGRDRSRRRGRRSRSGQTGADAPARRPASRSLEHLGGRELSAEELWSATAERIRLFNDAVRAAGRDPRSVVRSLYVYRPLEPWSSPAAFAAIVECARTIGLDELVLAWPGFLQEDGAEAQIDVFRTVSHEVVDVSTRSL